MAALTSVKEIIESCGLEAMTNQTEDLKVNITRPIVKISLVSEQAGVAITNVNVGILLNFHNNAMTKLPFGLRVVFMKGVH